MARRNGFNPYTLKKKKQFTPHRNVLVQNSVWRPSNRWRADKSPLDRSGHLANRLPNLPQYNYARS